MELVRRKQRRRSRPNRTKNTGRNFTKIPLSVILTIRTVSLAYKFASVIKCAPFEVIPGPGLRVQLFPSKLKQLLWYFANATLYFAAIFQAISLPRVILQQGLTTESALHLIFAALYLFGVLYFASMLADESTFVCCINSLDSLLQATKGEEWSRSKWYSSPFGTITIPYAAFLVISMYLVTWACVLLTPTHSRYIFSLLPPHLQDKWLVIFLSGLYESTIWIWLSMNLLVVYCYWIMVTFQQIFWLEEMSMESEACGCNTQRWRRLFTHYRALKCVNISHNSFNRYFLVGYYVVLVLLAVLFLYCTLKAYHLVPILLYLMFPVMSAFGIVLIASFTPYTAKWEQKSGDFIAISLAKLRILRVKGVEYAALFKEVRALQPLRSEIGFFDTTTVETTRELIGQVIDHLLLLLSL